MASDKRSPKEDLEVITGQFREVKAMLEVLQRQFNERSNQIGEQLSGIEGVLRELRNGQQRIIHESEQRHTEITESIKTIKKNLHIEPSSR